MLLFIYYYKLLFFIYDKQIKNLHKQPGLTKAAIYNSSKCKMKKHNFLLLIFFFFSNSAFNCSLNLLFVQQQQQKVFEQKKKEEKCKAARQSREW